MANTRYVSPVRSALPAYLSIAIALVAVVLIGAWGAQRDLAGIRTSLLHAEIGRLRSHGIRTVGRLENELERQGVEIPLSALERSEWLERFWKDVMPRERQRLYAAVVDADGLVVMHSDASLVGRRLEPDWRGRDIQSVGDVVETQSEALSGGPLAFDIVVPIEVRGDRVGEYHSGFDRQWFEAEVDRLQHPPRNSWIAIISLIAGVVLIAGLFLHRISKRAATLQQAISMTRVKQLSDLGRLVGALAHEIRNPLNAIRLNLHTIRQVHQNEGALTSDEIDEMLVESNKEVDRLSELMKTMLGYARTDQANAEDIDVTSEVDAIAKFLAPVMEQDGIEFRLVLPTSPTTTRIDRDRFRQVLLNLLNNAREAVGKDGTIAVAVTTRDGRVEITVDDTGPGVPESDRDRIFEPFYSTKSTGTGLGLALARRFAEEAGGSIFCDGCRSDGACFRIVLPEKEAATG